MCKVLLLKGVGLLHEGTGIQGVSNQCWKEGSSDVKQLQHVLQMYLLPFSTGWWAEASIFWLIVSATSFGVRTVAILRPLCIHTLCILMRNPKHAREPHAQLHMTCSAPVSAETCQQPLRNPLIREHPLCARLASYMASVLAESAQKASIQGTWHNNPKS